METLLDRLRHQTPGTRRTALTAAVLVALGGTVATGILLPVLAPYIGGVAGLVLFIVTVAIFHTELPAETQSRWDLRATWPINQRRTVAAVVIVVWAVALLLGSGWVTVPGYVGGTLTVWLVVGLAYFIRASTEERAEAIAAWEAHVASVHDTDEDASDFNDGVEDYDLPSDTVPRNVTNDSHPAAAPSASTPGRREFSGEVHPD